MPARNVLFACMSTMIDFSGNCNQDDAAVLQCQFQSCQYPSRYVIAASASVRGDTCDSLTCGLCLSRSSQQHSILLASLDTLEGHASRTNVRQNIPVPVTYREGFPNVRQVLYRVVEQLRQNGSQPAVDIDKLCSGAMWDAIGGTQHACW